MTPLPFVPDPIRPRRRETRVVAVGDVEVGGSNPIRIQSMTTTDTRDTAATCDQIERLAEAGCEIARVTAPSITDAENLAAIQAELARRGVRIPIVADIHYTPNAALVAAEHVEKVRVNPGNYADKKKFEIREYSDAQYREEIERVAERFRPLVLRCKALGRALRIGTNHGSLSDRIMNRYGDSPAGMVESALEFLDVCEDEGFHDVIFSMKASNARVAIQAYRLLAARLQARDPGPGYPFHLGVTEAGDGEDGRIKSAIGIGALLEDGIGETIRVSLTEDPVREVPVARALAARYEARAAKPPLQIEAEPGAPYVLDPYDPVRRPTHPIGAIGGEQPVRVELDLGPVPAEPEAAAQQLGLALRRAGELDCEGLSVDAGDGRAVARAGEFAIALEKAGIEAPLAIRVEPALAAAAAAVASRVVVRVETAEGEDLAAAAEAARGAGRPLEWNLCGPVGQLAAALDCALEASRGLEDALFSVEAPLPVHGVRFLAARLAAKGRATAPIVLRHRSDWTLDPRAALLHAATDLGAPLCDGMGDLVSVSGLGEADRSLALAYRILQGARLRTTWTEFISCPSCGRTLFDLEETTARIKERTQHLPGVKIAIMGCIVNGPGEMADADFGYVGSGPGRVNLYVGKELVERNVAQAEADDRLVDLIKSHDLWVDP